MIRRTLAAVFGAIVFGLLTPLTWSLVIGWPESTTTWALLVVAGLVIGAALGAAFPKLFGFLVEVILDV